MADTSRLLRSRPTRSARSRSRSEYFPTQDAAHRQPGRLSSPACSPTRHADDRPPPNGKASTNQTRRPTLARRQDSLWPGLLMALALLGILCWSVYSEVTGLGPPHPCPPWSLCRFSIIQDHTIPCAVSSELNNALMANPYETVLKKSAWPFQSGHGSESWLRGESYDKIYNTNYGWRRDRTWEQNFTETVDDIFAETYGPRTHGLTAMSSHILKIIDSNADLLLPTFNVTGATQYILSMMDVVASQRPSRESVSLAQELLEHSTRQRHSLDREVCEFAIDDWRQTKEETTTKETVLPFTDYNERDYYKERLVHQKSHTTKKQAVTKQDIQPVTRWLESQRQELSSIVFAEAQLKCWLRGQAHFQNRWEQWEQQILHDRDEVLLHVQRTLDGSRSVLSRYVKQFMDNAHKIMYDIKPAIDVEVGCRKEWMSKNFRHCVADKNNYYEEEEAKIPQPGCDPKPNSLLWEWHNAIPIDLKEAAAHRDCESGSRMDDIFKYSRKSRSWSRSGHRQ